VKLVTETLGCASGGTCGAARARGWLAVTPPFDLRTAQRVTERGDFLQSLGKKACRSPPLNQTQTSIRNLRKLRDSSIPLQEAHSAHIPIPPRRKNYRTGCVIARKKNRPSPQTNISPPGQSLFSKTSTKSVTFNRGRQAVRGGDPPVTSFEPVSTCRRKRMRSSGVTRIRISADGFFPCDTPAPHAPHLRGPTVGGWQPLGARTRKQQSRSEDTLPDSSGPLGAGPRPRSSSQKQGRKGRAEAQSPRPGSRGRKGKRPLAAHSLVPRRANYECGP